MESEPKTLASLTAEDFRPLLGQPFTLELGPAQSLEVPLIDVTETPRYRAPKATRCPFSITLRLPAGAPVPQGILGLRHPDLGRLEVFFVDVGPDELGRCFQAVFS
ncbi:MAG: hypothetical protein QM765_35065 [Myxococcales bacterium]